MTSSFGKELERMLDDCEVTRREVAERVGISTYMLWLLQAGKRLPTPDMIDRVVLALELSVGERIKLHRFAARDRGYRIY
jgi:transcriptional regulator with XRE-family HTH domain